LKAPGFNPRTYKVKNRFQSSGFKFNSFKFNLYRYDAGALSNGRDITRAVGGVGCFLAWTSLIQHFERLPPYDTAWIAVHKGLPVVTRFAVGAAPLLLGFACLGMALFSEVWGCTRESS
jgi:hypothetical protein